jgi:hypothetical protein
MAGAKVTSHWQANIVKLGVHDLKARSTIPDWEDLTYSIQIGDHVIFCSPGALDQFRAIICYYPVEWLAASKKVILDDNVNGQFTVSLFLIGQHSDTEGKEIVLNINSQAANYQIFMKSQDFENLKTTLASIQHPNMHPPGYNPGEPPRP